MVSILDKFQRRACIVCARSFTPTNVHWPITRLYCSKECAWDRPRFMRLQPTASGHRDQSAAEREALLKILQDYPWDSRTGSAPRAQPRNEEVHRDPSERVSLEPARAGGGSDPSTASPPNGHAEAWTWDGTCSECGHAMAWMCDQPPESADDAVCTRCLYIQRDALRARCARLEEALRDLLAGTRDYESRGLGQNLPVEYEMPPSTAKRVRALIRASLHADETSETALDVLEHPHLIDGEFQSDKYPTCPRGKVPLSTKDKSAQDLLWTYAQRRRAVDAQFSDDLEIALRRAGYVPMNPHLNCKSIDPPYTFDRRWQCVDCGAQGLLGDLMGAAQKVPCTKEHPPCPDCGQTPFCAEDCPGIALALSNVTVLGR